MIVVELFELFEMFEFEFELKFLINFEPCDFLRFEESDNPPPTVIITIISIHYLIIL